MSQPDAVDLPALAPLSHAVFRVARMHKTLARQLLRELGLHPGQELVLMALWTRGPQRMVDLVAAIDSDAPSMTRSVTRLEKAGLVSRRHSTTDGRVMIVEATEASTLLRPRVEEAWRELERRTVGAMDAEQQARAMSGLELLEETLQATESGRVAGGGSGVEGHRSAGPEAFGTFPGGGAAAD